MSGPRTLHDSLRYLESSFRVDARAPSRLSGVPVVLPETLDELRTVTAGGDVVLLAGGTDLMVALNHRARVLPPDTTVVGLSAIPELATWSHEPSSGEVTIGACVTWADLERPPFDQLCPALAQAARTVGSPQIRNAGTLAGNIATASPAGDGLPVLLALGATVDLAGRSGDRNVPLDDLLLGPKRTAIEPDEVITAIRVPQVQGWQGYAKIGVRNAMVISVAGVAVVLDADARRARVALGSVGPTVFVAEEASRILSESFDWDGWQCEESIIATVADTAAAEARPIDDHRSTAAYRRHGVRVLASRLVSRGVERR